MSEMKKLREPWVARLRYGRDIVEDRECVSVHEENRECVNIGCDYALVVPIDPTQPYPRDGRVWRTESDGVVTIESPPMAGWVLITAIYRRLVPFSVPVTSLAADPHHREPSQALAHSKHSGSVHDD